MLARMSGKAEQAREAKNALHLGDAIRGEIALLIGLGTAAIFLAAGSQLVEIVAYPGAMIVVNGFVGLCLLMGGLRYREQHYNLQGVNSYLNVIMTLAVVGLVLPNFTTTTSGPTFSVEQEIFLLVISLLLYAIFLLIQTVR